MVLQRVPALIGRMIVNKWMTVGFLVAFVILEIQILHTSLPTRQNEHFRHVSGDDVLRDVLPESRHKFISSTEKEVENNDDHIVIFYNRVPKTGSTSFMGIIYDLCNRNKFHALHLNVSRNYHILSLPDQMRFAKNITKWRTKMPAVYHGHLAYVEFAKFGVGMRPLYINIVREPLERLVSYYYFLRFGDTFRPHLRRTKQGDKETFDECVKRGNPDCRPEKLWLQIPFFCGHAAQCWSPGNKWALEEAKRNLVEKYLLVGVTDEIGDFVTILEATVPRIFKGATKLFHEGGKSHLRKTTSKKPLEQSTIEYFQQSKIWKMENEFYEFAYKVFQTIKKRALTTKRGALEPVEKQFFYEKIRPKVAN